MQSFLASRGIPSYDPKGAGWLLDIDRPTNMRAVYECNKNRTLTYTHTHGGGAGTEDGGEEEEEEGRKQAHRRRAIYERGEIGGPTRTAAAGLCNLYSFSPAQSRPSHTVRWLTRSAIISNGTLLAFVHSYFGTHAPDFVFFFFFLLPPISPSLSSCRRACS